MLWRGLLGWLGMSRVHLLLVDDNEWMPHRLMQQVGWRVLLLLLPLML